MVTLTVPFQKSEVGIAVVMEVLVPRDPDLEINEVRVVAVIGRTATFAILLLLRRESEDG